MRKSFVSLIMTCVICFSFSCSNKKKTYDQNAPLNVKVMKVDPGTVNSILEYSGNILPYKTIRLGFMVAGKIKDVNVQNGDYIKEGQLIASLDPTDYQFAVEAAKAQYEDAADELKRLKSMYDKGSLTQSDYDKINSLYKEAKANYDYKKKQLNDTRLYAPHSGYVVTEGVEPGEVIPQGMPLFGIVYTDIIYAEASIPEQEINKIREDMEIEIYTPSLNKSYKGKIEQIEAVADPLARAFPVKAKVENPDKMLKPGMITYLMIPLDKSLTIISIPSEAIITDANGHTYVYTIKENTASKQRISCGNATGSEVRILDGLSAGDIIVIQGQQKLYQGAKVNILQ